MPLKEVQNLARGLPISDFAYFEQVGSTNDEAQKWLAAGHVGVFLAVAEEQSAGRGRAGRQWHTPPGSALAFSLGFSAGDLEPAIARLGAGWAALAVCAALESQLGLQAEIKWPNDLLLDGEKFCGILAEGQWQGTNLENFILGIGINVAKKSVPEAAELTFPATYLEAHAKPPIERGKLLRAVLEELFARRSQPPSQLREDWEARLAFRGQMVELREKGQLIASGTLAGLNADGHLLLEGAEAEQKAYAAGEIQLRPANPTEAKSATLKGLGGDNAG